MITDAIEKIKKWKNIVKVCAALSDVKINEDTYVKGRIANGKTKYTAIEPSKFRSYPKNSIIVTIIVKYILKKSKMKLPTQ
jgi:hypothetical protein